MKKIIALLDKEFPPNHSFIDGMLAYELPKKANIQVLMFVSKNKFVKKFFYKYYESICIPVFFKRDGFKRVLNVFIISYYLFILIRKETKKGNQVVLFVRNDPIYLLTASFFRKNGIKLIFQSSFPHEEVSEGKFKRLIANLLYKACAPRIDSLLAVSPHGLIRMQKLFPKVISGEYIPLLAMKNSTNYSSRSNDSKRRFVYVGTHDKERKLEVIFKAIHQLIHEELDISFEFIGGTPEQIKKLLQINYVRELFELKILTFTEKIPRSQIWDKLRNSDIGISLIPPETRYFEASPTKLTEYMQVGLVILASKGIYLQEKYVNDSNSGLLVNWDVESISKGIHELSNLGHRKFVTYKKNSFEYAKNRLNYECYLKEFISVINS